MANTVANVSVGKPAISGGIWRAPLGSTLPTDATTALDNAFKCLGYISSDGVTNAPNLETDNIRAWGGDVVYTYQTGKNDTFAWSMIESLANSEVLKMVYGDDNVTTATAGTTVQANGKDLPEACYVIETILRGGKARRIVIPDGKISEIGEIVYQDEAAIAYPVTVTAMPDSNGNTHYEYTAA